jgi:hypothetical protein
MIGAAIVFVLFGSFFLFALFFCSCYWSLPMNSRSDREEVLTAVTSAPRLPYNKDDRAKRMRMYLLGLLGSVILISLLHFSFGYALRAFDKSIPFTCFETLRVKRESNFLCACAKLKSYSRMRLKNSLWNHSFETTSFVVRKLWS